MAAHDPSELFRFALNEAKASRTASKVTSKNEDDDSDDFDDSSSCPACGGPGSLLGALGNRQHFRCRNCGMGFSYDASKRESEAKETAKFDEMEPEQVPTQAQSGETSKSGRYTLRITYANWDDDSLRAGDTDDRGVEDELPFDSLEDMAKHIRDNSTNLEPSSTQFHPGVWYTDYGSMDYRKGTTEQHGFHPVGLNQAEERKLYDMVTGKAPITSDDDSWEALKPNRFTQFKFERTLGPKAARRFGEMLLTRDDLIMNQTVNPRLRGFHIPQVGSFQFNPQNGKIESTCREVCDYLDENLISMRVSSRGHLRYAGPIEYFERNQSIFRAVRSQGLDESGYRRGAKYVASINHRQRVLGEVEQQMAAVNQSIQASAPAGWSAPHGADLFTRNMNLEAANSLSRKIFSGSGMRTVARNVWSRTKTPSLHQYEHPEYGQLRFSFPKTEKDGPVVLHLIGRDGKGSEFANYLNQLIGN